MARKTFSSLVRQYFGYLMDDYGFSVTEDVFSSQPYSHGEIEFRSSTTVVSIGLDRFDIFVDIGPSAEPRIARLSLQRIVEFLTQGKETFILNPDSRSSPKATIESRLARSATGLRQHCDPVLRGDFSWWLDALGYFLKHLQDQYHSMTGLAFPENDQFAMYIRSKQSS